MKRSISFEIDEDIASKAEGIYNAIGMDTEMALSMFMRRTVLVGALPMSPIGQAAQASPGIVLQASASDPSAPVAPAKQTRGGKITQDMADAVWGAFLDMRREGGSANDYADKVAEACGMNAGSAFIYLVMLDNMVAGRPNTRNMKFKDLTGYVSRIREELGQASYENAITSLGSSLEYWDDPKFGHFATRVQKFLEEQGGQ